MYRIFHQIFRLFQPQALDKHVCCEYLDCKGCNTKQKKSSVIGKERAHYLRQKPLLGGQQELDAWVKKFTETHGGPPTPDIVENKPSISSSRYIVYDFEADTSTNTHEINHDEIDVLCVNDCYEYDKRSQHTHSFDGYSIGEKFCDWLFTDKSHSKPTVMAHNGSGYDFGFVLKWDLEHGLHPDVFIRSGNIILYMWFIKKIV